MSRSTGFSAFLSSTSVCSNSAIFLGCTLTHLSLKIFGIITQKKQASVYQSINGRMRQRTRVSEYQSFRVSVFGARTLCRHGMTTPLHFQATGTSRPSPLRTVPLRPRRGQRGDTGSRSGDGSCASLNRRPLRRRGTPPASRVPRNSGPLPPARGAVSGRLFFQRTCDPIDPILFLLYARDFQDDP